eukprot:scaffold6766_cov78-Skeletonema_dohrnii-CCMP3373.AAC.2
MQWCSYVGASPIETHQDTKGLPRFQPAKNIRGGSIDIAEDEVMGSVVIATFSVAVAVGMRRTLVWYLIAFASHHD